MGSANIGGGIYCFMRAKNAGGLEHDLNSSNFNTPTNANAQGNYLICRTNSTTIIPYKNNAALTTGTTAAAQARPTFNWFLFCHNGSGTPSPATTDEIASAFIGGAMTGTQALAKNAALNDYMTAQGCNVYSNAVAYSLQAGVGAFALSGKDATLTKTAAPGYTGPGDLTSGAKVWCGLRAYNAAYAAPGTNPCMRITDSGGLGSNETIINILSTGLLDYATLNAWIAAHGSPYVYQLYDQTGNGNHMVSAGAMSGRPRIVVSPPGLTTGRAALVFDGSLSSQIGAAVGTPVTTQPITVSMVCNRTAGTTGARSGLFAGAGSSPRFGYENGANTFFMYAGSSLLPFGTTANNTWYGVQAVYNDPSGSLVNYTSVAGGTVITAAQAVGTSSFGGTFVLGVSGSGDAFTGYVTEIGGWSGSVAAGMGANQIASL